MKTERERLDEMRAATAEVTALDVQQMIARGAAPILIDVRERNEWNLGYIPGAEHIACSNLSAEIEAHVARDAHVVLYCAGGNRSIWAAQTLMGMGYSNVASLAGGIRDWAASGGEIAD